MQLAVVGTSDCVCPAVPTVQVVHEESGATLVHGSVLQKDI
jgi:hypothetical protein